MYMDMYNIWLFTCMLGNFLNHTSLCSLKEQKHVLRVLLFVGRWGRFPNYLCNCNDIVSEVTPLFFTVTTGWDREDEAGGGQPNSPGSYRTAQEEENRLWRDQFCKSSVNFTFTGKREFFSLLLLLPYEHWFVFSTRIPKRLLRY